jgi:hypothetical protein
MASPTWTTLDSAAIERYSFNEEAGEISVVYRGNPRTYHYPCTDELYGQFLQAPSKGAYVQKVFKALSPTGR